MFERVSSHQRLLSSNLSIPFVLLGIAAAHGLGTPPVQGGEVAAAKQDARLRQRISVRAEGVPLSWVVRQIGETAHIRLTAEPRAGSERVVSFVPDASVSEVMGALADLYRLTWVRSGDPENPTYRLEKSRMARTDEEGLRRFHVRRMLDNLAKGLTDPGAVNVRSQQWSSLYPDVLPVLAARFETLATRGSIALPLSELPPESRARVEGVVQSWLDRARKQAEANEASFPQNQIAGGPRLRSAETLTPPQRAGDCEIFAEVLLREAPEIWVGLRTATMVTKWFSASSDGAGHAGLQLYTYRELRPTAATMPAPAAVGRLDRLADLSASPSLPKANWIGKLKWLGQQTGVALYADCYSNHLRGMDGHSRGALVLPPKGTTRAILDAWMSPEKDAAGHSVWWERTGSALIRSRRWLWEAETVWPTQVVEQLHVSLGREQRLLAADVPLLAGLTRFQVQGAGTLMGPMDVWKYAVEGPAHLTPRARNLLCMPAGLKWDWLTRSEQDLLANTFIRRASEKPSYAATIKASREVLPSQGGPSVMLELKARWGFMEGVSILHIPQPDRSRQLDVASLKAP